MPLDYQLIKENIESVTDSLHNSKSVDARLCTLQSPLTPAMMAKLTQYLADIYNSPLWQPETVQYDAPGDDIPRFKLQWDPETVFEELYEVCQSVTPVVGEIHPDSFKDFKGIMIWRDHPGYFINWHTDNPIIGVSMQIYITGSDGCPGTDFQITDGVVSLPFIGNSGYIAQNKIDHRISNRLSDNSIRYSLFAIWDR
jgi:hypothetical protein